MPWEGSNWSSAIKQGTCCFHVSSLLSNALWTWRQTLLELTSLPRCESSEINHWKKPKKLKMFLPAIFWSMYEGSVKVPHFCHSRNLRITKSWWHYVRHSTPAEKWFPRTTTLGRSSKKAHRWFEVNTQRFYLLRVVEVNLLGVRFFRFIS